jgi:5-methylcytosine-specific restriction endonuclease McrA
MAKVIKFCGVCKTSVPIEEFDYKATGIQKKVCRSCCGLLSVMSRSAAMKQNKRFRDKLRRQGKKVKARQSHIHRSAPNAYYRALSKFWKLFPGGRTSKENADAPFRFEKVCELSHLRFPTSTTYAERQDDFKENGPRDFLKLPCFICGSTKMLARHHMIQLQHGGTNINKNIITVCSDCHEGIHPWMRKPDPEVLVRAQAILKAFVEKQSEPLPF